MNNFNLNAIKSYCKLIFIPGLIKHRFIVGSAIAFVLVFNMFFTIGINAGESLPDHVFLIMKGQTDIKRGDYMAFRWNGGGDYGYGLTFVKLVKGVGGDKVEAYGKTFYIDGQNVGTAKEKSRHGVPLEMAKAGLIPQNHYYVYAPHHDSLDSRYAMVGLISRDRIQGKAIPLF